MVAITQKIPNLLGGISSQDDTKKTPGQVSDILNGYPDPTFGLLKRNGSQYLTNIANSDKLTNSYWFTIDRDDDENYICAVTPGGDIRIWNTIPELNETTNQLEWVEAEVVNKTDVDVRKYLGSNDASLNIHSVTYLDQTYLINKSKTVQMLDRPSYTLGRRGTVVVALIEKGDYTIFLDGVGYTHAVALGDTLDHVLTQLKAVIDAAALGYSVNKYGSSLEIVKSTPFTLEVLGGDSGIALTSYQDEVTTPAALSSTSPNGRRVKIVNSINEDNSYFVKFVGVEGSTTNAGTGFWQEDLGWDTEANGFTYLASSGFDAATMPVKLINTGKNVFFISTETWDNRLTGNNVTCPVPSFVGKQIKYGVLNSNRLALLSDDTVVMSVAKDINNFFYTSAQTLTAADPVDIDVPSFKVGSLYSAISKPQGLILFSQFEQFLLYSESGNLTPFDSVIRTIGQYESAPDVDTRDMGSYVVFVTRTPLYSKVLGMQPRGGNEVPIASDISQVISELLPSDIDQLTTDPQNSTLAVYSRSAEEIYLYKFYSSGEEQLMQAWFKWKVIGDVQYMSIVQNVMFIISRTSNDYHLSLISMVQAPYPVSSRFPKDGNVTLSNVRLDWLYPASSAGTITYDPISERSTLPQIYSHIAGKTPLVVTTPQITTAAPGNINELTRLFISTEANDPNSGFIVEIDETDWTIPGDWTGQENNLVIGYEFDFEVELPSFYYRDRNGGYEWDSVLTIGRINFKMALSGVVNFLQKKFGATEWQFVKSVQLADSYIEDTSPITQSTIVTVPIHQRNTNYNLKVTSNSPFPITINSLTWEGNYSTRYYRRA